MSDHLRFWEALILEVGWFIAGGLFAWNFL